MSVYFLDSSALIKRYTAEVGTGWIHSIVSPQAGHRIIIAHITPTEIVSGLARKQRELTIVHRTLQAAMLLLDRHCHREYIVLDFNPTIEALAKSLLTTYPLRAYDSVQLASALVVNQTIVNRGLSSLIFVTSDSRLLQIAVQENLTTDDPINHP